MGKIRVDHRGLRTLCTHENGAAIETDAPKENGGAGHDFSPTDLLAASLGACILTVMEIAARKIGVDFQGAVIDVEKEMALSPRRIGKLIVRFRSPHAVSEMQRKELEKAALHCPVHGSLHPEIKLEIDFAWGL